MLATSDAVPKYIEIEIVGAALALHLPNDVHLTLLPIEAIAIHLGLSVGLAWAHTHQVQTEDDIWIERMFLTHPLTAGERCRAETPELAQRELVEDWPIRIVSDYEYECGVLQIEFCNGTALPLDEKEVIALGEALRRAAGTIMDGDLHNPSIREFTHRSYTVAIHHDLVRSFTAAPQHP